MADKDKKKELSDKDLSKASGGADLVNKRGAGAAQPGAPRPRLDDPDQALDPRTGKKRPGDQIRPV